MALFDWHDGLGKVHTISLAQHQANQRAKNPAPGKGVSAPGILPPPPVGTYDPAIDYNAGASQRGYGNTQDDAQTAFEQGGEDRGISLADLTRSRDRTLADLLTQENDVRHNYTVLGDQQAGAARQHGITSAGLLQLSADKRAANQAHDLAPLTLAEQRANEDFTRGQQGVDLAYARQFGGFNGQQALDPITGQPVFGSLLTSLTRAGTENNAFQTASAGQRAFGAAANGYVPPDQPAVTPNMAAFLRKLRPATPVRGAVRRPAKGILY